MPGISERLATMDNRTIEDHSFRRIFFFFLFFFTISPYLAQNHVKFSGEIRDAQSGELIDYASISVDQAKYGTLSQKGTFSLILPRGPHTLKISHLGYKALILEIVLEDDTYRKLELSAEVVELEEVIISSDGRDPAYAIIRQAIDNKKKNKIPFPQYEYEAYTKAQLGFQEGFDFDSMIQVFEATQRKPRKAEKEKEEEEEEDGEDEENLLPTSIMYLSENVSRMYIKAPDKVKEEILSTRVSGASDQFSLIGNTFNRFDVYENRAFQGGIAERGVISPISDNAFFYYKYKLIGQIKEGKQRFYKILVTPKRFHDPVFQGVVYIADSSYAVQKLDLFVSKEQAIQFVDTLRIKQEYGQVAGAWLPLTTRTHMAFSFEFLVLKLPMQGTFTSLLQGYKVGEGEKKKKFGMEKISFADSALTKDKVWWDSIRPLPLSQMEYLDYTIKDSVEQVMKSPEYLDSLTKAQEFSFTDLLYGATFRNYRKKTSWRLVGLARNLGINPIEGLYIGQGLDRIWEKEVGSKIQLGYRIRYGFANEIFSGKLALDVDSNPARLEKWGISGGSFVQQFSRPNQIEMPVNNAYTVYAKRSFVRMYRKQFAEAYYQRELFNGFTLEVNGRYEDRSSLQNTSDYSFFNKDRVFDPNIQIPSHKALISEVRLSFKPFNKYMSMPNAKINMGSSWPLFEFVHTKGWSRGDDFAEFERVKLSASGNFSLAIFGNTSWRASIGKTLDDTRVFLPDMFHFPGNETIIHSGGFDKFYLMPYYEFSGTLPFVEAHIEHAFGGFIFNKIPGIRRLKISEFVGLHLLAREGQQPYLELNAGLAKRILKVIPLRVDFNVRLNGDTRGEKYGWKIIDPGFLGGDGSVSINF